MDFTTTDMDERNRDRRIIHEITPLMGKDVLYIADRRKKEFTYPIHNHEVYELNFVEHAPGVRRIVGDSQEVIGEYDLVLITSPDLEHVWEQYECKSDHIREVTVQFDFKIEDDNFFSRNPFESIRKMMLEARKGLAFPMTAIMNVYHMIDTLSKIEDAIMNYEYEHLARVHEIHNDIRKLLIHYEQIIDMAQELEENENGFFSEDKLRYIRLFMNLIDRRRDYAASLRGFAMQVHDLYHAHLEMKQNRIMTLLTVITTIFMPLTLIVGWYGMNFRYMPELEWRFGYPVVIIVSIAVVTGCLLFFKRRKWL